MADPFLLAHTIRPGIFQIGGKMTPISIRDQMLRGYVIVDRALEEGLITPSRPLLVIGAGAAGAIAAMHAAGSGVESVLIDKNIKPFGRQRRSRRWISPTQYDWPVNHWTRESFPWGEGPVMPLWWRASRASTLALLWNGLLEDAGVRYRGRLVLQPQNRVRWRSLKQVAGNLLEVDFTRTGGPKQFGMMLLCEGAGSEQTKIGNYKGFRFWDKDKFEEEYLGIKPPRTPQILISGGGDGALQDFLRIITKVKSAADIYKSLNLPQDYKLWIEHRILSAEDQANRAHIWSTPKHDHTYNEVIQQKHQDIIDELAESPLWNNVATQFRKILDKSQFKFNVELSHSCTHFSKCYGLNRFLVLLIVKYLRQELGRNPLRPNRRIKEIKGVTPHICQSKPRTCLGEDHQVIFQESDCFGKIDSLEEVDKYYNVIVVRHGLEDSIPLKRQLALPTRHMLPYYVAW